MSDHSRFDPAVVPVDFMRPTADDGTRLYRCCLCFDAFPIEQLNVLSNGKPEDVCVPCAVADAVAS